MSATETSAFGQISPTGDRPTREAAAGAVRARVAANEAMPMIRRQRIFDMPFPPRISSVVTASESYRQFSLTATYRSDGASPVGLLAPFAPGLIRYRQVKS